MSSFDRQQLRNQVLAQRLGRSTQLRDESNLARSIRLLDLVDSLLPGAGVISCYLSRDFEPDTLWVLGQLWPRHQVMVPALLGSADPDWSYFEGVERLIPGVHDIPEPTGVHLGQQAIGQADLHIVPALACGDDGARLGTGGGWYDRALVWRRAGSPIVALLNEDEVVGVKAQEWDIPVDHVVTEKRIINVNS